MSPFPRKFIVLGQLVLSVYILFCLLQKSGITSSNLEQMSVDGQEVEQGPIHQELHRPPEKLRNVSETLEVGELRDLSLVVNKSDRRVRFPFATEADERCKNLSIRFAARNSMAKVFLISYPGSGNTWLRHLTEALTGIFTSSIYGDPVLSKVLLGEAESPFFRSTVMTKAHNYPPRRVLNDSSVVFLIRNPVDAIISSFNFQNRGGHLQQSKLSLNSTVFLNFATNSRFGLSSWLSKAIQASRLSIPLHVVHYESLEHDLRGELLRLANFLGIVVHSERLECVLKYSEGSFRRASSGKRVFPLSDQVTPSYEEAVCKANDALINKLGQPLPLKLYAEVVGKKFTAAPHAHLPHFKCSK